MSPATVAIIGGGIGGLTLALALREHGITAEVHEQAPELREVGAAVALSANGTRVLQRLGLADGIARSSAAPTELIYRHWRDAHRIAAHPVGETYTRLFGAPYCGIHRADLQQLLSRAVGAEHVHLGHRLVNLDDTGERVRLDFADGTRTSAEIVVGADGVHSAVRTHLTGTDPAVYSGTSGFRGLVPRERLDLLPDPAAIQFWMGPGGHVLHYPIGDGEVINFLAVVDGPDRWDTPEWVLPASPAEITAAFDGWHPAVRQLVAATSLHQRWALFGQTPLHRWQQGRIALLGDAAHAMLPHHGQGANQTIEDAAALAALLARHDDHATALRRYEQLRRTRTRQVQRSSWVASDLLHLSDGPRADRRDSDLAAIDTTLRWIHGHDALAVTAG